MKLDQALVPMPSPDSKINILALSSPRQRNPELLPVANQVTTIPNPIASNFLLPSSFPDLDDLKKSASWKREDVALCHLRASHQTPSSASQFALTMFAMIVAGNIVCVAAPACFIIDRNDAHTASHRDHGTVSIRGDRRRVLL